MRAFGELFRRGVFAQSVIGMFLCARKTELGDQEPFAGRRLTTYRLLVDVVMRSGSDRRSSETTYISRSRTDWFVGGDSWK
jgi:hypothetical protein